jgi:hypothetical protein
MKKWIALAVVLAVATTGQAVVLTQGAKELAVEGLFDSDTIEGDHVDLTVFYGEYTEDNFEIGLQGSIRDTDRVEAWSAGVRFEHNFTQYEVVPYLALSIEYAAVKIDVDDEVPTAEGTEGLREDRDEDTVITGGHVGLKWFVAENVAVSGAFVFEWAGSKMFEDERGEFDDTNASIRFGMRYFF